MQPSIVMGFFNHHSNGSADQATVIDTYVGLRTTLTFSVEGLSARDELLFKGYVRLLDHLTNQEWQYHEASDRFRVDLLVANEHVQPTRSSQLGRAVQPVLLLGSINLSRSPFFLTWPLKPNELENVLNQLGGLICKGDRSEDASQNVADAPVALGAKGEPKQAAPELALTGYKLRQWPRPMLLAEPGRMRLATLISGKAMGVDELVSRSALPRSVCERFVSDMQTAGLLVHPDVSVSQHFGLATPYAVKAVQSDVAAREAFASTAKQAVSAGLIARIRMRFGIKTPSVR